jgi:hypothetical protein
VLGEEKSAKPNPRRTKLVRMKTVEVFALRKNNRDRLAVVKAIPAEATILGSTRSEILPARGEKTVITIG